MAAFAYYIIYNVSHAQVLFKIFALKGRVRGYNLTLHTVLTLDRGCISSTIVNDDCVVMK
jgi:hypothetical protein